MSAEPSKLVTCPLCRREFRAEAARRACRGCASAGGCRQVRCPYCGYEIPAEPRALAWLKSKLRRHKEAGPHA
jgi:hypothetical protein